MKKTYKKLALALLSIALITTTQANHHDESSYVPKSSSKPQRPAMNKKEKRKEQERREKRKEAKKERARHRAGFKN